MSKKDKIRERLFEDLLDTVQDAQRLDVQEVVWHGICFFTQMAVDCAPTEADGKKLVRDASKSVKKDKDFDATMTNT
tara:strand:- start:864 stop:1094 length:231 start_codon:yes stop_codon:yes gene_type:complete